MREGGKLGGLPAAPSLRFPIAPSLRLSVSPSLRLAKRSPLAAVGVLIVGFVLLVALAAPLLATADPVGQDLTQVLKPPFWQPEGTLARPLGTDHLGRDVYSRLVYLNLAFPLILLALAVVAILGPSIRNLIIVLALTTWMIYARVVRGISLGLREREFVQAARAIGARDLRIIARHILPNVFAPVVVIWTLEVARVILMESALSFLGLGVPPPTPTWGRMLAVGRDYLTVAGWIAIFPGLAIMVTVLGINFLGDGLRDLLDPRLRGQM